MKLLIVRHADPDYSIDSLTPTGWEEAELLSRRMETLDVKAFYVSPLGRARDTANVTLRRMGREAQVLDWLREFPVIGVSKPNAQDDGVAWDWLPQDWLAEPNFFTRDRWTDHPAFRDTNVTDRWEQVTRGLDELLAQHGYLRRGDYYQPLQANEDTIVLFCHFGLECVLLSHLLHISPMLLWHGTCAAPSSVTTLTTEERRKGIAHFRMNAFGDISHLYCAGREPSFHARFCETFDNPEQRHD